MTSRGNGNSYEKSRSLEEKEVLGMERIQYHAQLNLYYTSSQVTSSEVKKKIGLISVFHI